jgi:hypothetical protein
MIYIQADAVGAPAVVVNHAKECQQDVIHIKNVHLVVNHQEEEGEDAQNIQLADDR